MFFHQVHPKCYLIILSFMHIIYYKVIWIHSLSQGIFMVTLSKGVDALNCKLRCCVWCGIQTLQAHVHRCLWHNWRGNLKCKARKHGWLFVKLNFWKKKYFCRGSSSLLPSRCLLWWIIISGRLQIDFGTLVARTEINGSLEVRKQV